MKQGHSKKPERQRRKRYTPPRILSREPLEAMANVCAGPVAKTFGLCSLTINS